MSWGYFCRNIDLVGDSYDCAAINSALTVVGQAGGFDAVHSYEVDQLYPVPNLLDPGNYDARGQGQDIGTPNGWTAFSSLGAQNPPDVCDTDIYLGNGGSGPFPWYSQYTSWGADGSPNITFGAIMATGAAPTVNAYLLSLDSPGRQPPFMAGVYLDANTTTDLTLVLNTTAGQETLSIPARWDNTNFHIIMLNFSVPDKRIRLFIDGSEFSVTTAGNVRWNASATVRCSYGGSLSTGGRVSYSLYRSFMGYGDIGYSAGASLYDAFLDNFEP